MTTIGAPKALLALASAQDHVLHRDQLHQVGVTRARLRAQLSARRWQAVGPSVVVLHNGPLTPGQQTWVAVLSAPGLVAVAGRGAAAAWGLSGWGGSTPEIVVRRGDHLPALPFAVRVHESRRFTAGDVHRAAAPYRTGVERSILDAATWTRSARAACGLLAASVQQKLTSAERLGLELDRMGRVRHCAVMRAVLVDIGGGAQALSEVDFGRFLVSRGLPAPRRQVVRLDADGRRRFLDVELEGPEGQLLHLEVDGALHLLVATYWQDMDRGNELVLSGSRLLRFPSIAWRLDGDRVESQIRRGLGLDRVASRAA